MRVKAAMAMILVAGTVAQAQSLTTLFARNNAGAAGGAVYFDVEPVVGLTINSFDVNTDVLAGSPFGFSVYTMVGTHVGNETNMALWTLRTTGIGTGAGLDMPSAVVLDMPFELDAGVTYGMAIALEAPGQPSAASHYTNGTGANQFFQNADLSLSLGSATNVPFSGSVFTPRVWNGTVHYTPSGPPVEGACCFGDGSCSFLLSTECVNQGGSFRGGGTDCATANCPQLGACCLQWGGCDVILETECDFLTGATFLGANTTCPGTCETAGGCCLADGSCVYLPENDCTTLFNGTWAGAGVNCGEARCATAPVLWNNGPLMTSEGIGCNLGDVSELQNQAPLNGNTLGFNWNNATNSRLADQFIIPDGEEWNIEEVVLFGYDTGAFTVTYTAAFIQIWDGDPRDPGSSIVAGDQVTNVLTQADQMNLYRATVLAPFGCDRHIQEITTNFQTTLGPGTYWIDRSAIASGTPWMPPVTFSDLAGKPNANGLSFFADAWAERTDSGNNVRQDMPFILVGSIADACYANCDGSTSEPILTVNDFTCFINEFASAQALTEPEQIVHYANCDGSTTSPVLTVNDFTCFINEFAQGCP